MRARAAGVAGLALVLFLAPAAAAQSRWEPGVTSVSTFGEERTSTIGPTLGWRPGWRDRLVGGVGVGIESGGHAAGRGELIYHVLLSPGSQGLGLYGGGGLALLLTEETRGLVQLLIGLEHAPGGRDGWHAELGVGSGVRLAFGYRWRLGDPQRR